MSASEHEFNRRIIEEFRANDGRVGGRFQGVPLLLLHHRGARSGIQRVTPVVYQDVGGGYALFAANGGRDTHPAWYHNLLVNPDVHAEIGTATVAVTAREVSGAERDAIWERQKRRYPFFADYEAGLSRQIPVIVLEPRRVGADPHDTQGAS